MTVVSGEDVIPESTKFNLERILGQNAVKNSSRAESDIEAKVETDLVTPKTTAQ
jgi:hypothetical protein